MKPPDLTLHPAPETISDANVRLLTIEEAAALCRSSYGVIYKAVKAKKLPSGRAGRRIVVSLEALLSWLQSRGETPEPAASSETRRKP